MSAASEPAVGAEESEVHTARKEGREVVTMRSFADGDAWIVECDVYPVTGMRVDPLRPGPYRFPSQELANVFLGEASKALSDLGCELDETNGDLKLARPPVS